MATLDPVTNFAQFTVLSGYNANAYSITLLSGGALLPSGGGFNLTWWNSTDYSNPAFDPNVEIVRVQSVSGNVLTLVNNGSSRTPQEGTASTAKNLAGKSYSVMLGITAKMITDIGNNLQQPWKNISVSGAINGSNAVFTLSIAPYDPNSMHLYLAWQLQMLNIDYTLSGTTITYTTPPPASLAGSPHVAQFQ